ncbi:hypothetical protein AYO20_09975 [Fonsecaea nubica]|uniref:C2H2-type domain-containing protein n=1 Tax=Fonsecaea nubica TaxID=856822 RepID=A0A178CB93_9EURO|nr:hypothetical protein AYO20_09975 [Fonsecaea nubica]OAL26634.1 hypothetical protein AYO20_09975 [Fonsecaea nubica]
MDDYDFMQHYTTWPVDAPDAITWMTATHDNEKTPLGSLLFSTSESLGPPSTPPSWDSGYGSMEPADLPSVLIELQPEETQVTSPAPEPSPPGIRNTKPQNAKTKPRYVCPVPSCRREYVRKSYYDSHIKSKHPDYKLIVETDPTFPQSLDAEPKKDSPDQRDLGTEYSTPEEHSPKPP